MGGDKIQVRGGETGFGKKGETPLLQQGGNAGQRNADREKLEAGIPLQWSLFNLGSKRRDHML